MPKYTSTYPGKRVVRDRDGNEHLLEPFKPTPNIDLDTKHPTIKAWLRDKSLIQGDASAQVDNTDTIAQIDPMGALRAEADELGVKYANNIGLEKLTERVEAARTEKAKADEAANQE